MNKFSHTLFDPVFFQFLLKFFVFLGKYPSAFITVWTNFHPASIIYIYPCFRKLSKNDSKQKLCTYYFDEQNIIPKLLNQYMKSSVWKEILEIDFRSLKTYQSFLWLLDASKAPGDQHCFMEQCQSRENNQKIYIYNENLWRWCPKMCQEM